MRMSVSGFVCEYTLQSCAGLEVFALRRGSATLDRYRGNSAGVEIFTAL